MSTSTVIVLSILFPFFWVFWTWIFRAAGGFFAFKVGIEIKNNIMKGVKSDGK